MKRLRQWLIRLTTTMTQRHGATRLREDIDEYVAFETEANLRRGLPPAEARRRALLTFGSMGTSMPRSRSPSASGHARLRYAWRSAPRAPMSVV
jgi:hypothetical protein